MAEALGKRLGRGAHVSVFKNFGTAQVKYKGTEVEFVGDVYKRQEFLFYRTRIVFRMFHF